MAVPIIHYEFNTSDLGTDSSGNSFNSVSTGATLATDGIRGPVAEFSGTNSGFTSISNVPSSLSGDNPRTFMCWVKRTNTSTKHMNILVYGDEDVSAGEFTTNLNSTNRTRTYILQNSNGSTSIGKDTWYHVSTSYDGTALRMYTNGIEEDMDTMTIDTQVSRLSIGADETHFSSTFWNYWEGQMSDFRVYDVALTQADILAASQGPVVYPSPFGVTPSSTLVETSWLSIENAISYRMTIDPGSGESVVVESLTPMEYTVHNLDPDTAYTLTLYSSVDGTTYTLGFQESITTLSDTSANAKLSVFLNNGVYDLSIVNDVTQYRLLSHLNDELTTGESVVLNMPKLKDKKLTLVTRGSTSTIPSGNSIIFPFTPSEGGSQSATLELSDTSTVVVTYDESNNQIDVGGTTFSEGDKFILDGKKVTVYDI